MELTGIDRDCRDGLGTCFGDGWVACIVWMKVYDNDSQLIDSTLHGRASDYEHDRDFWIPTIHAF